jgi:hypothetical protein
MVASAAGVERTRLGWARASGATARPDRRSARVAERRRERVMRGTPVEEVALRVEGSAFRCPDPNITDL